MKSPGTKIRVLVLRQPTKDRYSRTLQTKKNPKTNLERSLNIQLQNLLRIEEGPCTIIQGPHIYWYVFHWAWALLSRLGRNAVSHLESCSAARESKVEWSQEGEVGSVPDIFEKWERRETRGLTPSRLLCMPFRGIRGQIQSIQEAKNIRALVNSWAARADAMFKLCASNSQPVFVNTHGLQQQAQRDIQKRDVLFGLCATG